MSSSRISISEAQMKVCGIVSGISQKLLFLHTQRSNVSQFSKKKKHEQLLTSALYAYKSNDLP